MPADDAPCNRCGQSFSYCDDPGPFCLKCVDLGAENVGGPGYIAIDVQPQCEGCGVYYPALKGYCGRCKGRMRASTDDGPDPALITKQAEEHSAKASRYRLNQSSGLSKVHDLKARENVLKQQRKAETVTIEAQLFIFAAGAVTAKKLQIAPFLEKVFATANANDTLSTLLKYASTKYLASPVPKPVVLPSFGRDDIQFSIMQGGAKAHSFDETKFATGTVGDMFETLKQSGHLTEKDSKNKTISLRIDLWAGNKMDTDDEDEDDFGPTASGKKKLASSRLPPRATAAKRKVASSSSIAALGPPSKRYQSAFKAPQYRSEFSTAVALTFDSYSFVRTFCTVSLQGEIQLVRKSEPETILVAKGWQKFARAVHEPGVPTGGYLSSGYSKYGFKGIFGSANYALFQSRALGIYRSTEEENANELTTELKLLAIAQYFLDTFRMRAASSGYKLLPNLNFNASGAFVGTLTRDIDPAPEGDGEIDDRSLIYNTFLAAPLLPFGKPGYEEEKWSGTNQTGDNDTKVSRVIAAFAHHSVLDSGKTCLLVDLQGLVSPDGAITLIDPQAHTTWPGGVGYFDCGLAGIEQFLKEHECNAICRSLDLSGSSKKKDLHCNFTCSSHPSGDRTGTEPVVGYDFP